MVQDGDGDFVVGVHGDAGVVGMRSRAAGVVERPAAAAFCVRLSPSIGSEVGRLALVETAEHLRLVLREHWHLVAEDVTEISTGLNSRTWAFRSGPRRYVAKSVPAADPFDGGLIVAESLARLGMRTGPPLRTRSGDVSIVEGPHRLAVLRWEPGKPLPPGDPDTLRLIGTTLGRVHVLLGGVARPEGVAEWPWEWLRNGDQLDYEPWLRPTVENVLEQCEDVARGGGIPIGLVHGDPNRTEFLASGDDVALIDWGACVEAPFIFDLASFRVLSNTSDAEFGVVVDAYTSERSTNENELAHLMLFVRLRWAIQAWYFAWRLLNDVSTGGASRDFNLAGWSRSRNVLLQPPPP